MIFLLTIFGKTGFYEYRLPDQNDSHYHIRISKYLFELKNDLELFMVNIDGYSYLLKSEYYQWTKQTERNDRFQLKKDDCLELKTENGERLSLIVTQTEGEIKPYKKYIMKDNVSIGRDFNNDIIVPGKQLISRKHAIIKQTGDQWSICNLSVNGFYINGRLEKNYRKLQYGDFINILSLHIVCLGKFIAIDKNRMDIKVSLQEAEMLEHMVHTNDENALEEKESKVVKGKVLFRRSPRSMETINEIPIEIKAPPMLLETNPISVMMSSGAAVFTAIPMMIGSLFMIFVSVKESGKADLYMYSSLIMILATVITTVLWSILQNIVIKKARKKEDKERVCKYLNYLKKKDCEIRDRYITIKQVLQNRYISAGQCSLLDSSSSELWNRNFGHNDFFKYRLGVGDAEFNLVTVASDEYIEIDELEQALFGIKKRYQFLREVPMLIDIEKEKQIGIIGETEEDLRQLVRILVAQIVVNNCYTDVKIGIIYDSESGTENSLWEDCRWFPHVWNEEKTRRFIASNREEAREMLYQIRKSIDLRDIQKQENSIIDRRMHKKPYYILFVSAIDFLDGEPVMRYFYDKEYDYGVYVMWIVKLRESLPNSCQFIVEKNREFQGFYSIMGARQDIQPIVFDRINQGQIRFLAEKLAAIEVQENEENRTIPDTVTFFQMMSVNTEEELFVLQNWTRNNPADSLRTVIGCKAGGKNCYLDIHEKYHGPHGLVAGTTGSGKSELLQTYIISMAVNYSPEMVNFFLIDYKGGGMSGLFDDLPHLCGQISNLSGAQAARAMVALKSENKRRQKIFKKYGVNNINTYIGMFQKNKRMEPIPHLIIIIDEFAELKKEEPNFMQELVSVAQVGRSLGIHLILATQKPGGTVDEKIWSNTRFRLCLKVQEKQDSQDMIHKTDAAFLTQTGRGYFQVGNDEIFELFQSGWSGAPLVKESEIGKKSVELLQLSGQAQYVSEGETESIATITQVTGVVKYIKKIAEKNNFRKCRPLWMEPLPSIMYVRTIEKAENKGRDLSVCIGLIDDPENQRQIPLEINLKESGHIAVCGMACTGKSTMLQTLVYQFVKRYKVDKIQFYIIDYSGSMLNVFESMPHVGAVILEGEEEKAGALFVILNKIMQERKKLFRGGTYMHYCDANRETVPVIVLIIDNFSFFQEKTDHQYEELILKICKEGERLGIICVFTCGGFSISEIPLKIGEQFKTTLCLEMKEKYLYEEALGALQIPVLPEKGIKGRGLVKKDKSVLEYQIGLCIEVLNDYERMEMIRDEAARQDICWKGKRPEKIRIIPKKPILSLFFKDNITKLLMEEKNKLPVGYESVSADIYSLDREKIYCYLISGKRRSGKHNFFRLFIEIVRKKQGRVCIIDQNGRAGMYKNKKGIYRYMSTSEEIFSFFEELLPMFVKRNQKKHEDGGDFNQKKNFSFWQEEEYYYIFIEHLQMFLETANKPDCNITGIFENLWEKGAGHNIMFVGITETDISAEQKEFPAMRAFSFYQAGVHFGGSLIEDDFFCHKNISYTDQIEELRPGTGIFFCCNEEPKKVVVPVVDTYGVC